MTTVKAHDLGSDWTAAHMDAGQPTEHMIISNAPMKESIVLDRESLETLRQILNKAYRVS